ncbi:MAG: histone deacetylase family protein [Gammaproteobacteria bacterium]
MQTAYITHPYCFKHEMVAGHPECPARLMAIEDQLKSAGLFDFLAHYEAPKASTTELARVHHKAHIHGILSRSPKHGLVHIDPDTCMNPYTAVAALRAAGSAVLAAELVTSGQVNNAFCCVRPPGHHCERGEAMGFCFFNNVAVGVAHALTKCGVERIAVVDFDVHHGNGTEDIFEQERRVLVCSAYQHPLYPYRGRETVDGHLINVPLDAGSGSEEFRHAVETHWLPQLERFQPQMIFISAGFDAHHEDDMAELNLTEADYAWVTRQVMAIAAAHARGRIVSLLEGGYALHALGRSVAAHVRTLMNL